MKYAEARRAGAVVLVTAIAGASLAAQGGASAAATLNLKSKKQGVKFTTKKLTAKAGKVTIKLKIPKGSQFPHSIAIKGNGVDKKGTPPFAQGGKTAKVTAKLKKGKYTFYCPVGEHAANGMKGTLTVK
jgi:plastocyanin